MQNGASFPTTAAKIVILNISQVEKFNAALLINLNKVLIGCDALVSFRSFTLRQKGVRFNFAKSFVNNYFCLVNFLMPRKWCWGL